ncbi:Uncharacterized protein AC509_1994 [Pseudomonas amygdali pv. morsprunorum]|nr:Uncharacterized protein AC509_1994 [Pseudomonas amygdali pv. morsprunorum]
MQILHALKRNRTTTFNRQVLATLQLRSLILLIAAARQQQVATGSNFATDIFHIGHFVTLGFLRAEAAFFLHVVQRIITVLRSKNVQILTRNQIRLFPSGNTAGDHGQILPSLQSHTAARFQVRRHLADMIFLLGHLLAFAVGMLFISRRGQGQVFRCGHRDVALGVDAAGDHVDVATGLGRQVASGADCGAQLRDAGITGVHAACLAVLGLGRVDSDVTARSDAQITTSLQHAAGVFHVTTRLQGHVVSRFDTCRAVSEILTPGRIIRSALMAGHGTFVDDIAAQGGQCHITSGDNAPGFVDQVITCQQVQTVASFYQAAVDQVISSGSRQVIGRTQGADVIEVLPGNQRDVVTCNQRPGRAKAIVGLSQIQHWHQHLLAIHFVLFEPDDVVGQRCNLL